MAGEERAIALYAHMQDGVSGDRLSVSPVTRDAEQPLTAEQWGERLAGMLGEFEVSQEQTQGPSGAGVTATTLETTITPGNQDDRDRVKDLRIAADFSGFHNQLPHVTFPGDKGTTIMQLTYLHPTTKPFPGAAQRIQQMAEAAGSAAVPPPGRA